jgi:hypothetical protein
VPVLSDAEFRIVAEVETEMARFRGTSFGETAKGYTFARAALIDPAFKARLAEVHRRLMARRSTDMPHKLLAPIAPLFRDLERDAEAVLSGCPCGTHLKSVQLIAASSDRRNAPAKPMRSRARSRQSFRPSPSFAIIATMSSFTAVAARRCGRPCL